MTQLSYTIPVAGSTTNAVADPEVATALQSILTWANGNIDQSNVAALLAQSAGVNQTGQTVKGAVNIATSQSTSSTTYTTLSTPDQVTGIVLPSNGLIAVWYHATWQESVSNGGRAAIFLGSNQVKIFSAGSVVGQSAGNAGSPPAMTNRLLATTAAGLVSTTTNAYPGDVLTGQIVGGQFAGDSSSVAMSADGATYSNLAGPNVTGGPCMIFASAGTYTVSVQFKASAGTVTASNRKLWVQAISFG